jgi:hypothetical protein
MVSRQNAAARRWIMVRRTRRSIDLRPESTGARHRVLARSKRSGTLFPARQRGISLSKGVGSQFACSKPVPIGLFREAATNGCPSGEERTPRSVDRGVFHFRGGVAGIWGVGGVRAVVSHLSLGGSGRSA